MVIQSLRERTRHLHEQVEAAVALPARLTTVGEYRDLLERFYGLYRPFEDHLARFPELDAFGMNLVKRRKVPLLERDLSGLGLAPGSMAALPECPTLPVPLRIEEALGCMYVTEGATLGGQYIRRQVEASLGLSGVGVLFFSSYGGDVGPMWKEFCATAESAITDPDAVRRACDFAAATFNAFKDWLVVSGDSTGREA